MMVQVDIDFTQYIPDCTSLDDEYRRRLAELMANLKIFVPSQIASKDPFYTFSFDPRAYVGKNPSSMFSIKTLTETEEYSIETYPGTSPPCLLVEGAQEVEVETNSLGKVFLRPCICGHDLYYSERLQVYFDPVAGDPAGDRLLATRQKLKEERSAGFSWGSVPMPQSMAEARRQAEAMLVVPSYVDFSK